MPFVGIALVHFAIGYAWGKGVMADPLTIRVALLGTFMAGIFTRLTLGVGTGELYFFWAGPLAATVLSDTTRPRNFAYSGIAFVLGFLLLSWLNL
ncbi:MAG TPA: hypothetical protein VM052_06630 [Candidatus Limnocylindrales bacterium]|nr:hypothetical protein [Candidatus Limnocylindrales bacterium]